MKCFSKKEFLQLVRILADLMTMIYDSKHHSINFSSVLIEQQQFKLWRNSLGKGNVISEKKSLIAISSLQARGGTDIGNGMKMVLSILKHRKDKKPVSAEEKVREDLYQYKIRDSFTIKTVGFGGDCRPKGQFYFIPNLTNIDECFTEALGGLVSVVANYIQLSVQPMNSNKTQIKKAQGDKWIYDSQKGAYALYQPNLLSGVRKGYIFEVPDYKVSTKQEVRVLFQAYPVEVGGKVTIEQIIEIKSSDFQNEILLNYYRVKGLECFEQAKIYAEQSKFSKILIKKSKSVSSSN
ncbi:unnamed protein product (macronuclear) [Paramecium tetraurelia]|uniref:Uncharacterized protein n=1 Tax=Paramecium tetraurelia TaxID=5888 RepID=A0BPB9_PARTE|nr:uncharacterized protein GSPATT00005135001 [Paramecium tetraurelia]CAK60386.1 unnamed protein product [Paramecium tetraurelia]|eukprot:XP_001427784.1 hypothetical protein (macronuclear) [Paramecium tetraurelia strain d4-2]